MSFLEGLALAIVLGTALGVLVGISRRTARALQPLLEFMRAIPPPVTLPIATLLIGYSESMKLTVVVLSGLWPILLNATSDPKPLQAAGATADGAFANYGLAEENIRDSEAQIVAGAKAAGRAPDNLEIWQIAALDCNEDRNAARGKVGAMLAFLAGYVIGDKNLETRGVPEQLRAPLLELRRRYSTRPGEADIKLVEELGLFDYLSRRLSICGDPQDCLAQALAARAAGAQRA